MIRSPQQLPGAEELCSAGFPCFDKNNINSNANIEAWSGNMASGTKTMAPPGLSSVLQPCGDHKQKQRGHQTRRIAPGVLLAAENSVTANEGWIYGWDGTLRGLHHHYMQLCSGGGGPEVMCGAQFDADGGSEERNNHLYSFNRCSSIQSSQLLFSLMVLKPRSH